ncbi:hypothetical protein GCM10028803_25570 [Larkinella knui]|uniref:Glycosyltransferase RgtA/B/C/D-like domain-containing protein n=1 Tax=Larkinella knui TaxID=2025310 RepID=A0A3P1CWK3_9BACT|nr:hypothetical protein [Larkinella knui]RRB17609.1 hypothetical protein EHT87_04825 [Larkinella knui]
MKERFLELRLTIFDYLAHYTGLPLWKPLTAFLCVSFCLFLNNPDYQRFQNAESINPEFKDYRYNWQALTNQISHPLTPQLHPQISHQSKRTFRLLPAIIGKVFPVQGALPKMIWLFAFQHVLGFLCFYLVLELVVLTTKDNVYALIATLGFSFIYFGNSFFWDLYGWFDGIAYFLLVVTLYSISKANWAFAFLSLTAAFWTDERALIVSPIVLFWLVLQQKDLKNVDIKYILKHSFTRWYLACLVCYFGIRTYLGTAYGLTIPLGFNALVGFKMVLINLQPVPNSVFSIYEGLWLPFILMIHWLWNRKNQRSLLIVLLFFSMSFVSSLCVVDVTRSLTYTFPWILFAIVFIHRLNETDFSRTVILTALLITMVYPNLFYLGKTPIVVSNYNQIINYFGF